MTLLRTQAVITAITASVQGVATHPEDDVILATAVTYASHTASPVWLVTGDKQLQKLSTYQEVQIVTPQTSSPCLASNPNRRRRRLTVQGTAGSPPVKAAVAALPSYARP